MYSFFHAENLYFYYYTLLNIIRKENPSEKAAKN